MKKQQEENLRDQSNQRQAEEDPLSASSLKPANFSLRQKIQPITNPKKKMQGKRLFCCHTQAKVISVILCLLIVFLVGMNFLIAKDGQAKNNTTEASVQGDINKEDLLIFDRENQDSQAESKKKKATKNKQQQISQRKTIQGNPNMEKRLQEGASGQLAEGKAENSKSSIRVQKNKLTDLSTPNSRPPKTFTPHQIQPSQLDKTKKTPPLKSQQNDFWLTNIFSPSKPLGRSSRPPNKPNKPNEALYNILSNITKNPYEAENFSMITKKDLRRAIKLRTLASHFYNKSCAFADEELAYYQQKYNIGGYEQLPFCIVIPTYNNQPRRRAEFNIKSVLMQNYSNFRFIVIDDGSSDATVEIILRLLKLETKIGEDRYRVIRNTQRHYALPNVLYAAKNFCKPKDIFMVLDGDDELIGRQVLKLYNAVFQKEQIWFMYTNFVSAIGSLGYSRPYPQDIMKNNSYRDYGFTVTHLRAYYTQLLLNIKDEDLRDQKGEYFTAAGDMAIVMPCLQQAHQRVLYVPEVTYYYNLNTGANVHKKRINEQRGNNLKIRAKTKYQSLQTLF